MVLKYMVLLCLRPEIHMSYSNLNLAYFNNSVNLVEILRLKKNEKPNGCICRRIIIEWFSLEKII